MPGAAHCPGSQHTPAPLALNKPAPHAPQEEELRLPVERTKVFWGQGEHRPAGVPCCPTRQGVQELRFTEPSREVVPGGQVRHVEEPDATEAETLTDVVPLDPQRE